MSRRNLIKNKKGEIGETINWIVATIIILGILLVSVYITSIMSNLKIIREADVTSDLKSDSQVLEMKTSLSLRINNIDREKIENALEEKNG